MNLLIELVRGTGTGDDTKYEYLNSEPGNAFEDALVGMAKLVAAELPNTTSIHPSPTQTYEARIKAYEDVLKEAYERGTGHTPSADNNLAGTSAIVHFGAAVEEGVAVAKKPSIYVPGTRGWAEIEGKNFQLLAGSDDPGEQSVINKHTYYLQIRSAAEPGDCEYKVSTASLSSLSGSALIADVTERLKGVTVFLSHTRSVILSIRSREQDAKESPRGAQPIANPEKNVWTYGELPELTEDGRHVIIRLRFIGDPAHIREATLLVDDDRFTGGHPGRRTACLPFSAPPPVYHSGAQADLNAFGVTWEEEIERRRCLMESLSGDTRAHRFFFELDEKSSPEAAEGGEYAWLGALLSTIYMERARVFDETAIGVLPVTKGEMKAIETELTVASDLILSALATHFGSDGKIDYAAVNDAFMRFASGKLQIFDTHGAPNGVNMFAFPELARMCMVLGTKEKMWAPLFSIFARAAEVFVRSYHAFGSEARSICAYKVEHNPLGLRGPTAKQEKKLGKVWKSGDAAATELRFSRLVHAALFDEVEGDKAPTLGLKDYTSL